MKATFLLFLLCIFGAAFSQNQNLHYAIKRNGKKVGDLTFQQLQAGAKTTYSLQSEVKVSMVWPIVVKAKEQSVYENGVLQSSSLVRQVNGKQKANKQITNSGKGLMVSDDGDEKELKNYSVRYNIHCLYSAEPLHFTNVFADNYQQFIPIVKLADHQYRVTFPDGNNNDYFYENGVCRRVKVKTSLFEADFVLTSL